MQSGGIPDFSTRSHAVYLINGPIHYDFALPLNDDVRTALSALNYAALDDADAQTLIIGWGAHTFYTTIGSYSDVSGSAVWRGIFGDASVMRVDVTGHVPENHSLPRILLTDLEYQRFLQALADSFADTTPSPQSGHTATDAFFPAKGTFNILQTCNVWVGQILRRSGVPFGIWTPLPLSVTLSHRLHHSD